MATAAEHDSTCDLIQVGTLELEHAGLDPEYYGLVVLSSDKVMVADGKHKARNLRLHSLQDGHLLAVSNRLESGPWDVCICSIHDNEIHVAVCLWTHQIEILSIQSTGQTSTITRVRKLDVRTEFDYCTGVKYLNGKLLICGKKQDNMYCCIVSITDGHVEKVHKICKCGKYSGSYLSTNPRDDNMVYISCDAGYEYPENNGVYGYINSTREFLYQHKDLNDPRAITTDRPGFIFVCNYYDPTCIHHLTEKGQLVTIYREGMPSKLSAVFWEEQQGLLYITSYSSKVITIYRPVYSDHQDTAAIPAEILRMNDRSIQLFKEALKHGEVRLYNIRVMVVGHLGVGKTTMIKRLLGEKVNITERQSTEGIIVHVHCCRVSRDTWKWTSNKGDSEQDFLLQRLAKVLNEKQPTREKVSDKESIMIPPQKKNTLDSDADEIHDKDTQPLDRHSSQENFGQNLSSTTSQQDQSLYTVDQRNLTKFDTNPMARSDLERESHKKDPIRETLQLLLKNADALKLDVGKYAPLTMWDFAGQYAFYTTHQMFLTRRAIYLLVSDVSGQANDLVEDECYFDCDGIRKCRVHELVEVWLNSIHSCAPSDKENTNSTYSQTPPVVPPPVILVGTHVDQIRQEDCDMVCEGYFNEIRSHLSDKPSRFHLVDEDFAIDNTVVDSKLEDLKRKIVEVASQQLYWGEKRPAHWLLLEQALMKLKAEGFKVIPLSLVEDLKQAGTVQMSAKELDLFLRFQHDIGTILYFSKEVLKDNVVLDPQWMIDALKSLITAEMFVLRSAPAVSDKWFEFKKDGKLSRELIDAIWTKERNPDFHVNKEHILQLMEHLNIIAKPMLYNEDASEIKVENYFIAPCMLREPTPRDVISPAPHPLKESSPVLCYVFMDKFLPAPIFHRLLAACVAQWSIAKKKSDNLIFCGCGVFDVNDCHKLTLHFKGYVIYARVTKMSLKNKTPDSEVCIQVKKFIDINLSKIIGYLCQNLKFEWHIQCPQSETDCLDSMFPVSKLEGIKEWSCSSHDDDHLVVSQDLLKFWFKDKQMMDPLGHMHLRALDRTTPEECQMSLQRRVLPPGKKYHVFFSFSNADIEWVRNTVGTLEKEHGFLCCEYDRDNTPGTPLLKFASDSIKNAYKTVVVMTQEGVQSGFVLHEIDMAITQGINERRKCVVPVLLEDCEVPSQLSVLNYIDARDPKRRDLWWPRLLTELETLDTEQHVIKPTQEDKSQVLERTPPKVTLGSANTGTVMADKSIEAEKKHNQLCCTLDGLITKDSFRNLKRMSRTYLDRKTLEKVENMDDLLSALEDRGKLGVGNYDILIEIMTCAGVGIVVDEIHKTAKDIRGIMESSIPSQE